MVLSGILLRFEESSRHKSCADEKDITAKFRGTYYFIKREG